MTKTKTAAPITPQQRLTIVKHLANGRGLDFTAAASGFTADQVRDVGSEHGWPREASLAQAADLLTKNLDRDARATITPRPDLEAVVAQNNRPSGQARREANGTAHTPPPRPHAAPTASDAPSPAPDTADTPHDGLARLLARAAASERKRSQNLGLKIAELIADLRTRLDDEDQAQRDKARKEAERKAALDEVRAAEKALAEARAKARRYKNTPGGNGRAVVTRSPSPQSRRPGGQAAGSTSSAARAAGGLVTTQELQDRGIDSKTLRAWAADNGVHCPITGRVPRGVLDAYDAANRGASS